MLVGLEPSRELTGGSWYSGTDFDYELIRVLQVHERSHVL